MTGRALLLGGAKDGGHRPSGPGDAGRSSWRCRLGHAHRWAARSTDDGGRYQACVRCGVDRGPVGYGPMTTPPRPGAC